jgi:hypothetical protein
MVTEARDRGLPAYAETCPQYLFLSYDNYEEPGFDGAEALDVLDFEAGERERIGDFVQRPPAASQRGSAPHAKQHVCFRVTLPSAMGRTDGHTRVQRVAQLAVAVS